MPIRVAGIEVSHWHSVYDAAYLRHLVQMPDVQLVGLQDTRRELAELRAAELGHPPVFTSYQTMLAETRPDFVLAWGNHSEMRGIADYLLDQGYPFLMEKPMGRNAADVRHIADRCKNGGGFAGALLCQRYQLFTRQARRMIAEETYGPLSHIYLRMNLPTSARYPTWGSPWMLDPAIARGGCLRNLGPHGLDLFLYLTGEAAIVTGAQFSYHVHEQRVEDYASVLLRSKSGVLGTIEVGNTFPRLGGIDKEWKVVFRNAILLQRDGAPVVIGKDGDETVVAPDDPSPYYQIVRDTLDHWQAKQPPPVSAFDCFRAVQLIDAAYQMAGVAL